MSNPRKTWLNPSFWVASILLTIPINWFVKIGENNAYAGGMFIDYLIGKIYLSDIVLVAWMVWLIWHHRQRLSEYFFHLFSRTESRLLIAGLMVLILGQLTSVHPGLSLLLLVKIVLIASFGLWIATYKNQFNLRRLTIPLVSTLAIQLSIGSYQFLMQRAIAGYWLMGEPALSQPTGIAKELILGVPRILAYGTTPHPNILAGLLVIGGWVLLSWIRPHIVVKGIIWILMIWGLWITQSLSAGVSVIVIGLLTMLPWSTRQLQIFTFSLLVGIPVGLALLSNGSPIDSILRRAALQDISFHAFSQKPLAGVGLGQSASLAVSMPLGHEVSRFAQPPHHAGIVLLVETGILGVLLLTGILWFNRHHLNHQWWENLAVLAPLLAWDHYLTTLQIGWLLLLLITLRHNTSGATTRTR